jgi:hypothetical protein
MVMALVQILTVTVTMGTIDPIKQTFLFSVLCDICFVTAVVWSVGRVERAAVPLTKRVWGVEEPAPTR